MNNDWWITWGFLARKYVDLWFEACRYSFWAKKLCSNDVFLVLGAVIDF
jgi:hypothetical protein